MATTVGSTTAAAPASATQTTGRATGMGGDFNTFLTLLTTQLKNQDPTKAMDAQQMTAQLVQFAQVEQAISMNTNMAKLIGLQQAAQLTAAAPLMGKTVEVSAEQLALQDGTATLRLPAAGAAREARIVVLDANGGTIKEATVALGAATTEWVWDGRDTAGNRLPDGAYRFAVAGRDAGGGVAAIEATVRARATAAERGSGAEGGDLKLRLGGLSVGFDAVRSVEGG